MTADADIPELTDAERWAAAAAWSQTPALTPLQTVLWRSERHPSHSATSCLVIMLDSAPDWERFRASIDWGTSLVRRLRQRVLEPAVPTTEPVWVDDEHFALDYHLRQLRLGGDADETAVLEVAQQLAMTPFDRTRPLWEGVLVTGLADGRAAYALKFHSALTDARGTVQLLSLLQSRVREHTADKPTSASASGVIPDPVTLASAGLTDDLLSAPARSARALRRGIFAARHPRTVVGESLRYAASVRRIASPPPAPGSPLLSDRDGRLWSFVALSCDLEALRRAGRSVHGSLQDAFVAAVLGGLRRYHNHHDLAVEDLPIGIRVSLDRADDPLSGNRFAGAMIAGPAGIIDPADRIAAVRGEVLSLHTERALDALRAVAPIANRLPSDIGAALLQVGAAADAQVSVLPGPAHRRFMAGAEVTAMYPFGPLPGVAITASLLTYADRACIGLNIDGRAVEDLDVLERALAEGLDEVLALG